MPATTTKAKQAAKSAVKKATAAPAKAAKAPAGKPAKSAAATAPARQAAPQAKTAVPPDQRRNYIEVAAYFIAERHGFMPGRELADWAAAEAEIDRLLAEGRIF